jgi:hypothetical protein
VVTKGKEIDLSDEQAPNALFPIVVTFGKEIDDSNEQF